MRIAVLCTNFQPTHGWATVAVKRSAALMKLGLEIVAITTKDDVDPIGVQPTEVRRILPPLRLRRGPADPLLQLLWANRSVAKHTADCDLIDVIAEPYILSCMFASRSRPLAVTACGTYVPYTVKRGAARWLYRRLYRSADICAISEYTARRIQTALGDDLPPKTIVAGVDYDAFQSPRPVPDKKGPTIISVGAVKPRKGTHILIEALATVRLYIPTVQCMIIGSLNDKPYVQKLKDQIAQLQLQDTVHLTGRLEDDNMIGWYQHADIFALPSLNIGEEFEGLGLVHLEANACGLPAVGSLETGSESAILHRETGYLVEQGNHQQLATYLIEFLQDQALRIRMSQAARQHAQAQDWLNVGKQVLAFYESVLRNS